MRISLCIRTYKSLLVFYFDLLKFLNEIHKNLSYDLKMKREAINKKKTMRTALRSITELLIQDAAEIIGNEVNY